MWKIILNIFALLVVIFVVIYQLNYAPRPHSYEARGLGVTFQDFTLERPSENEENYEFVSLSDFKDKVLVLYFGFTACPDVCPMALSYANSILDEIKDKDQVQVIFISVDYKRDTPKSTMDYARFFNPSFIGLTGAEDQIRGITRDYKVYFDFIPMPNSEMDYTVDHTSRYFIFGKENELLYAVHSNESKETIKDLIENALKR